MKNFTSHMTNVALCSCLPEASLEQCVAHYVVVTCAVEGNLPEMARTTAKYIVQGADPCTLELHPKTKAILRAAGLKYNIRRGVGYPQEDGSMRYFAGRSAPTVPLDR